MLKLLSIVFWVSHLFHLSFSQDACAEPDNENLGDNLIQLDGDRSHYDAVTDGVILYIYTPQRYTLTKTNFRGQANTSVEFPDGIAANFTFETDISNCIQTITANIPLSSFYWSNMEEYFSKGRMAFYTVTMFITLRESLSVQGIDVMRTSELPITFFLYLSLRTQLFPEIVKTTVDEAFEYYLNTKVAVRSANLDGTSRVEIEFETGMNNPWQLVDFTLVDHWKFPDRIIPGTENLTMIGSVCPEATYTYEASTGVCVDSNQATANAMYTTIKSDTDGICEDVCNLLTECMAYDVFPPYDVCEVIGVGIPYLVEQGSWSEADTPGYDWTAFYDEGTVPIGGDGRSTFATCYIKGAKSHFCQQSWLLTYEVDHVCGVDARHNLTLFAGLGDDLKEMSTDVYVYYNPTCAKVIDFMTLVGELNLYRTDEYQEPWVRMPLNGNAFGRVEFTDRPLVGVTVNEFTIHQLGSSLDAFSNSAFDFQVISETTYFDFSFFLPDSLLEGTIKGRPASLTLDLTVEFGGALNTQRRLLVELTPKPQNEDVKSAAFTNEFYLVHSPCEHPTTAVGEVAKDVCPNSVSKHNLRICTKRGWNEVMTCEEQNKIVGPSFVQMGNPMMVVSLILVSGLVYYRGDVKQFRRLKEKLLSTHAD